jgi:hypothetical protein
LIGVLIKSTLAGVLPVILGAFVCLIFGFMGLTIFAIIAKHGPEGADIGWDLVSMFHNREITVLTLAALMFISGFTWGYRHFSRVVRQASCN